MTVQELEKKLSSYLRVAEIRENALNGLQVGNIKAEVNTISFAVDACQLAIAESIKANADTLIVHHGLFWGTQSAIRDTLYDRIRLLIENNITLLAYHIPLDMHPEIGNNIQIARHIGLNNIQNFGDYHGMNVGFRGVLPESMKIKQIADLLPESMNKNVKILPYGREMIQSIAVISGGYAKGVYEAITENIDLYITGEGQYDVYHTIRESQINVIYAGHYETETIGIMALKKWIENEYNLKTVYIEEEY